MTDRRTFLDELRELDQATQAEQLRPGAVHRIARRLDAELLQAELPSRRRTWIPMLSFAAGAALVLAVFAFGEPEVATQAELAPAPMHAAWQVTGDNCHVIRNEVELVLDGSCRVQPVREGVVIESRATTRLRPVEGGVALVDGTALLEVMSGPEGVPWRVEVPGGVLELLATRLSVMVVEDHGHLDLLEGTMRFVADDGRVHAVEPGQRFRFGADGAVAAWVEPGAAASERGDGAVASEAELAAAAASEAALADATASDGSTPAASPEQPALAAGERLAALGRPGVEGKAFGTAGADPKGPPEKATRGRGRGGTAPSSEELRRVVDQVAELRAQRQYQAAVSLLRDALRQRWDRRTREVLSYELGTILSTQLDDASVACTHWAAHREQFPSGRYARAIGRAEDRLSCKQP